MTLKICVISVGYLFWVLEQFGQVRRLCACYQGVLWKNSPVFFPPTFIILHVFILNVVIIMEDHFDVSFRFLSCPILLEESVLIWIIWTKTSSTFVSPQKRSLNVAFPRLWDRSLWCVHWSHVSFFFNRVNSRKSPLNKNRGKRYTYVFINFPYIQKCPCSPAVVIQKWSITLDLWISLIIEGCSGLSIPIKYLSIYHTIDKLDSS